MDADQAVTPGAAAANSLNALRTALHKLGDFQKHCVCEAETGQSGASFTALHLSLEYSFKGHTLLDHARSLSQGERSASGNAPIKDSPFTTQDLLAAVATRFDDIAVGLKAALTPSDGVALSPQAHQLAEANLNYMLYHRQEFLDDATDTVRRYGPRFDRLHGADLFDAARLIETMRREPGL